MQGASYRNHFSAENSQNVRGRAGVRRWFKTVGSRTGWYSAVLLLLTTSLLSGCLSKPGLVPQSFTFATPPTAPAQTNSTQGVLAVHRLSVAAPYSGQAFIYRTGASAYEQDPYAQFLVPPDESLAEPVRAYLRNSGRFQDVTQPGSSLRPDILLEIFVTELYGDFRNRAAPAAVLSMDFVFLPGRSREGVLARKTFTRRVPLKARTASALMAGWNEALKDILMQAASLPLAERSRR